MNLYCCVPLLLLLTGAYLSRSAEAQELGQPSPTNSAQRTRTRPTRPTRTANRTRPTRTGDGTRPTRNPNGTRPTRSLSFVNCTDGTFMCDNGDCIEGSKFCDLTPDCSDRSDEFQCKRPSNYCLPWQNSCPGENGTCLHSHFQCNNGKCIPMENACDRQDDCGDRSDEVRSSAGLKCIFGSGTDVCVLPQRHVLDNYTHCADEADSCYNDKGEFTCFRCFNGRTVIASTQICDGVVDCRDLSDECLCTNGAPPICQNVCRGKGTCRLGTMSCGEFNNYTAAVSDMCNGRLNCPDGADEKYCRKLASGNVTTCPGNRSNKSIVTAYVCDGRPECYDFSDECDQGCPTEQPFCALRSRFQSPTDLIIRCSTANGSVFQLSQQHICDGQWSPCEPRILEEETNCTGRFECQSGSHFSIDKALVCNGYADCDDSSDEMNCTDRFYCTTGTAPISVRKNFMFDDFFDCKDGSDECPPDFLAGNKFSSRQEMISNLFLKIWLWIMAVAAVAGNGFVLTKTAMSFKKLQTASSISKANHFLIFNLALADSLMGIYLVILAGYSIRFSGNYCFEDEKWRTGSVCRLIGALAVVSSEASVFILSVLTAIRLYTVSRPMQSRNLRLSLVFVAVLIAWGIAVLLAVLPISSVLDDVVTDSAWIPSRYFNVTRLSHRDSVTFSDDISIFSPLARPLTSYRGQILPWADIITYLDSHSSGNVIRGLFGFYSLNSVCVSKLFVTSKQPGWQFSIAIVSTNFILFVFVATSYLIIYKLSTVNRNVQSSNDRATKMQRKIIKLVATDFACWVPICILVFLHFSEVVRVDESQAYIATAVVLLPINSVLNPLLYSNAFENLWAKSLPLRRKMRRCLCCLRRNKLESHGTEMMTSHKNTSSGIHASNLTHVTPLQTPVMNKKIQT